MRSIRKIVHSTCNACLEEREFTSVGYSLPVGFLKGERGNRLTDFVNDTGIIVLSEAKDHDRVDKDMPFIGVDVDRCCSFDNASATLSYVCYVEVIHSLF